MTPNTPTCIELSSGAYLNLGYPDPALITAEVVAHHLATINRYGGAARRPLSVAEHACLVADRLAFQGASTATQLVGLHHDDAEAFVGDMVRPLKLILPEYVYREHRLWLACVEAFNLPTYLADMDAVKAADDWALSAEAYHLLPSKGVGWFCEGLYDPAVVGVERSAPERLGVLWRDARDLWLSYERRLRRALAVEGEILGEKTCCAGCGDADPAHWREGGWYCEGCASCEVCQSPYCENPEHVQ